MHTGLVTIKDAARFLGVSQATLRRWDKDGRLRAHRHPLNGYRLYALGTLQQLKKRIDPWGVTDAG